MRDPHEFTWINDLFAAITKFSVWIFSILIGVIAKISMELVAKRRLNFYQWIGIIGISVFTGYLTSVYCINNHHEALGQWLVPIVTILGEKIMQYITQNYKRIGDTILSIFTKKQ